VHPILYIPGYNLASSSSNRTRKPSTGKRKQVSALSVPVNSEEKIDIRVVAARAGVSIATVSRAINHVRTVDPVLAERVWQAVDELNYFPNTQARALVSGRSRLLGLIVSEITNPFFPELIHEFEQVAVERGYEILIASTNYERGKMESCARRMLERKVDGVAVMTFGIEDFLFERFAADNIPVVFIDAAPQRPLSGFLTVDYGAGINEAVQHLAVLGHRRIGFIAGPLRLRSAAARRAAFVQSMRSIGLTTNPDWLVEGDHTLEGGRDAMQKMLRLRDRSTAVLCSNDMTAIGVQHALFEAGMKVPDDLSIIGLHDSPAHDSAHELQGPGVWCCQPVDGAAAPRHRQVAWVAAQDRHEAGGATDHRTASGGAARLAKGEEEQAPAAAKAGLILLYFWRAESACSSAALVPSRAHRLSPFSAASGQPSFHAIVEICSAGRPVAALYAWKTM